MKISFIAPFYKMNQFLEEFLQSFSGLECDHELIIVNDDPETALEVKKDNVKIINNKNNMGPLLSRWEGVKNISNQSTHVIFIDPDDKLNNVDFVKHISPKRPVNFSYNEYYSNKNIYRKPDGHIGENGLDNHIWGISFPIDILKKFSKYFSNDELNDDFAIKEFIDREFGIEKSDIVMIDYRMRKSSLSKKTLSSMLVKKEMKSYIELSKKYGPNFAIRGFEELLINKRSLPKSEYLFYKMEFEKKTKIPFSSKFNGTMYRITSFGRIKLFLTNVFMIRKMFK